MFMMARNRREFAKASALLTAASWARMQAQGPPSDRVRLGLIGCGIRGSQLLATALRVPAAQVVAAADLYNGFLEHAKELASGANCNIDTTKDYRRVLDRKDIDAVIVATPDHWHARILIDAARAGKDAYAEKPMLHHWEEAAPVMRAIEEHKRIVQVGGGRIGSPLYQQARDIVQSGRIGKVTMVSSIWDSAGASAAWQIPIPPDATPETIDWKAFLGRAPERPFDPKRFFRWRGYWDYGGGLPPDLWTHHLTVIHWITGAKMPASVMANGAVHLWNDGREVPDTMSAHYAYPEGFSVTCSSTKTNSSRGQEFHFMGTTGALTISRNELTIYAESGEENFFGVGAWPRKAREQFYLAHGLDATGQPRATPRPRPLPEHQAVPRRPGGLGSDLTNFLACVRSRQAPAETADSGRRASLAAIMANISYRNGRLVSWDEGQQRPVW